MTKNTENYTELKVLNVEQLSHLLGLSCASIRSHWQRRNFEAIPRPVHFGRRLGWPVQIVEEWLQKRIEADSIWR
jgi:predicted DNA-binding transcriptional regulator AlpA